MSRSCKRSRSRSPVLDLSLLPANLLDLKGDAFYTLVKEITSEDIEDLLKVQKISTVRCFLHTDPFALFNLDTSDSSVIQLQNRLSIKMANKKNIVLAGIDGDLLYLKRVFAAFVTKNKQKKKCTVIPVATGHTLPQLPSTTMTPLSAPIRPLVTSGLSASKHRVYLGKQIDSWWEKNWHEYRLENHPLIEPDDYELIVDETSAAVKCSCGQNINLLFLKDRPHYQLSNFYKHLIGTDKCTTIQRKWAGPESSDEDDSLSSPSSPLLSTSPCRQLALTTNNQQSMESTSSSSHSLRQSMRNRTE